MSLEDEGKTVNVIVRQFNIGALENFGHGLERHILQQSHVGSRKFYWDLHDFLDEAAARSLGVGIPLGECLRDDLLVECENLRGMPKVSGQLHELEDRSNLVIVKAVDVVNHDDDALSRLGKEGLERTSLFLNVHR